MKTLCSNVIRLPSGATLKDFILVLEKGETNLFTDNIEVCVPESHAIYEEQIEAIDDKACVGCFNCLDIGEIDYISIQGSPSIKPTGFPLKEICEGCFQGKFFQFGPAPTKLSEHTKRDERLIANPLAALLLWNLSEEPSNTFFCSSPSWELSLNTANPLDEREGHLDIVISTPGRKLIYVLEGKSSVDALLRDTNREQWERYYDQVMNIGALYDYSVIFSYVIGGDELALYPNNLMNLPHHWRREEFYDFISINNKQFLSIESLRSLRAFQISMDPEWCWENWFPALFSEESSVGILSGGIITRKKDVYRLEKAPWIKG